MTKIRNSVAIHARVPETISNAVKQAAADDDRTFSYIVRQALETYLKNSGHLTDGN